MSGARCKKCSFCESAATHIFRRRIYNNRARFLTHCRDCGLYFTSPHPTGEEIAAIYLGDCHAHLRIKCV
ncbi:MAG TPA: hypothetical protein PKW18_07280 [Candidatus Sumerlaeota bacterium]|nr:hypothetical protein [Candidatus Sumerlaeota bacterium]HRR31960.1 hypothetical protein [Candidatus Sumerlaeia bacterium]HON49477.1 hypothetical protein [Candidatus Sumerlaeota bacterium]HOR64626.1 hypothetical protein [Candidatus Sumerlaeota bacterium]HPL74360.1 hypothetical protein [Candidatus Sumerlaeota bacterium]